MIDGKKVADIHILPEVGHMSMYEAPKKVQDILRNFIAFCLATTKNK